MQEEYRELKKQESSSRTSLYHPYWQQLQPKLCHLIMGQPKQDFLQNDNTIAGNMVRLTHNIGQKYEEMYLTHCVSPQTKQDLLRSKDTKFGSLPKDSKEFKCSISTLGHLFYAAKILEATKNRPLSTIVEFGGGYGNLARILKQIYPQTTIIMIDIPEMLVIQGLFLRSTLPHENVILHQKLPETLTPKGIHLIPVFFSEQLNLDADLFISTFALSEATEVCQNIIIEKQFYEAKVCYISGQLQGWNNLNFVHHSHIHHAMRSLYPTVTCQPFHELLGELASYEIIGIAKEFL